MTTESVFNRSAISRGKKIVLVVFIIWVAQAIPKWTAAIVADDETSAKIVGFFITPRAEAEQSQQSSIETTTMTASQNNFNPSYVSDSET